MTRLQDLRNLELTILDIIEEYTFPWLEQLDMGDDTQPLLEKTGRLIMEKIEQALATGALNIVVKNNKKQQSSILNYSPVGVEIKCIYCGILDHEDGCPVVTDEEEDGQAQQFNREDY